MILQFFNHTAWLWVIVYLAGVSTHYGFLTEEKWRDGGDPSDAWRALAWPGFFTVWLLLLFCETIKDMLRFVLLAFGIKLK